LLVQVPDFMQIERRRDHGVRFPSGLRRDFARGARDEEEKKSRVKRSSFV
jgi:hypothetical protein